MIKASVVGAAITGGVAATIATAIGGGITAAEVGALGDLLTVLGKRADLLQPALQVSVLGKTGINVG